MVPRGEEEKVTMTASTLGDRCFLREGPELGSTCRPRKKGRGGKKHAKGGTCSEEGKGRRVSTGFGSMAPWLGPWSATLTEWRGKAIVKNEKVLTKKQLGRKLEWENGNVRTRGRGPRNRSPRHLKGGGVNSFTINHPREKKKIWVGLFRVRAKDPIGRVPFRNHGRANNWKK